jgi:hypothetical protein
LRVLGIPEMKDFPNIPEIHDFSIRNLGNLDKSMISRKFHKQNLFETETFFPEKHFHEKLKLLGEKFLGEKFLFAKGLACGYP